jgi:hypothetical protein
MLEPILIIATVVALFGAILYLIRESILLSIGDFLVVQDEFSRPT